MYNFIYIVLKRDCKYREYKVYVVDYNCGIKKITFYTQHTHVIKYIIYILIVYFYREAFY